MAKINRLLFAGSTIAMTMAATSALAQTGVDPTTAGATAPTEAQQAVRQDSSFGSEDIIVTAQKTSEAASKTPVALSVFTGDALKDQGVVNVADLRNLAPSLEIGSAAQGVNIAIRGVQTTDVTSKGEQGVVFSVDGVPIGRPQIIGLSFFDLDRVEVLRGPQGTLYGKSATGGAINVITAKPRHEFDASVSAELGNYDTKRGELMVNVPVSDNFALRAAAAYNKRDGYLSPVLGQGSLGGQAKLNDEDNWTARLSGLYTLGSSASVLLTGTYGHIGGTGSANNGALYSRVVDGDGGKSARQVYYNPQAGFLDDDFWSINTEVNADLGPVHLTYVGAHIDFKANDNKFASTGDPAGAAGQANYLWTDYDAHITTDSHEVRLSNATAGRLTWVVGANYINEKIREQDKNWQTLVGAPNDGSAIVCAPPTLLAACTNPNPNILGVTKHKSEGVFGQASFEIVDRLRLTGGVRYSHDNASRNATLAAGAGATAFLDQNGNPCAPPNGCVGTANAGAFKGGKVTWRGGIDFQASANALFYGSVSTGYKAGSFNDVDPTKVGGGTGTYGAEELTAYEVGFKGRLIGKLNFNSSVYYYDYSKFQLTGATFLTPNITGGSPVVLIYTKLVPVKLYGWENEATWRPTPRDNLSLGFTLSEGKYNGYAPTGFIYSNQIDFDGKRLDQLPKFTARASYEHRFPIAGGGYISARVNSKYSSGYVVSDLAGDGNPFAGIYSVLPQQYKQDSFTRSDANLGYTSASGKYSIDAFVRNIEGDVQLLGPPQGINPEGAAASDRTTVRISDPRFYGVRFSLRY